MECAVTGSNLHKIRWYYSSSNIVNIFDEDVLEIANSSKYTLQSVFSTEMLRVTLRIKNLNEETDIGTYYCRAFLLDGTVLHSPNAFELKERSFYEEGFPCSPNVAIKSAISVCARPYVPTTPDVSTTPAPSPTYTTMLLLPTTTATPDEAEMSFSTMGSLQTVGPPKLSILYIGLGACVIINVIVCIIFGFVTCIMCKRAWNKGRWYTSPCYSIALLFFVYDCRLQSSHGIWLHFKSVS